VPSVHAKAVEKPTWLRQIQINLSFIQINLLFGFAIFLTDSSKSQNPNYTRRQIYLISYKPYYRLITFAFQILNLERAFQGKNFGQN
jgi:hypothetical protein